MLQSTKFDFHKKLTVYLAEILKGILVNKPMYSSKSLQQSLGIVFFSVSPTP